MTTNVSTLPGARVASVLILVLALVLAVTHVRHPLRRDALTPAQRASWRPDMRIDVNTATVAELTVLPGIGPRLAERILAGREATGRFESVDDLTRVKRIGPVTVEGVRPYVVVGP